MFILVKSGEYGGYGKVVHPNEAIVSLDMMLVYDWALSSRRRTLSICNLGLISDYYLFDPLKKGLRGRHYAGDKEEKTAVMK